MPKPFCDRLTVSVPVSHDAALLDVCTEFAGQLGGVPEAVRGRWLLPHGGTFFYQARSRYASLEASGQAVSALREATLFADYLTTLGALPHRVTRLDATLDLPQRSAPFLHELYGRGKRGAVYLGRKAVDGSEVIQMFGRALYPGEPLDTGTVYVPMKRYGSKRQYLTAYDKRQERLARGYEDPGDLLRIEVTAARDKGATLSDAWDPAPLFYEVVSPSVLPVPPDVPTWSPAGEAWHGAPVEPADPRRRLRWALDGPLGAGLLQLASYPGGLSDIRLWLDTVETGRKLAGGVPS